MQQFVLPLSGRWCGGKEEGWTEGWTDGQTEGREAYLVLGGINAYLESGTKWRRPPMEGGSKEMV